ncbi:hypothetical protein DPMN_038747 [Dreissena polymorpha]|uniref:Uncharacterized protein n=1 Tax=Dreissena polymorpha TaxID=45954 RepID=A0A9D4MFV9_DREPO|nr:hypothetical protein DPMN_038747 [Dreissena polymorpha]
MSKRLVGRCKERQLCVEIVEIGAIASLIRSFEQFYGYPYDKHSICSAGREIVSFGIDAENMTDKDLLDSDYDGISQIHEHSYIVISDSDETQPPSPFG